MASKLERALARVALEYLEEMKADLRKSVGDVPQPPKRAKKPKAYKRSKVVKGRVVGEE